MSLIVQIKVNQLIARKARAPEASLLTTLLGEASMVGKNDGGRETTDMEVIAVVRKFLKGLDAILEVDAENSSALMEIEILKAYLPQQMDKGEIALRITEHCVQNSYSEMRDMGKVMKFLNETYPAQFDGKMASGLVRTFLSV